MVLGNPGTATRLLARMWLPPEEHDVKRLHIVYRKIEDVRPRAGNPRTHSKKQLEQLAKSIARFGFVNPALLDDAGTLIAGHGRVEAARMVGLTEIPTVTLSSMSDTDIRAYVIADNRLAEKSGWDPSLLAVELGYLADVAADIDLTVTGFELAEIEGFLAGEAKQQLKADRLDRVPDVAEQAITQLGEVWQIGDHRLICADATKSESYRRLLITDVPMMVFSDPPYNVPINGHVSGLGKVTHREFPMAAGEMSSSEFVAFLRAVFRLLVDETANGSIHYHCIDWRSIGQMLEAGTCYDELKNICVWSKGQGGMGALYRSAHELVCVFKNGTKPHINNIELGKNGRYRTNVWSHPGASSFGKGRDQALAMHPTVKPVALVYDAILDCSRRGNIILDPFAGSGTTLVAAQKARRRGYGIELDRLYCDVIVRRMQHLFKLTATRDDDGRTFDEIAAERGAAVKEIAA